MHTMRNSLAHVRNPGPAAVMVAFAAALVFFSPTFSLAQTIARSNPPTQSPNKHPGLTTTQWRTALARPYRTILDSTISGQRTDHPIGETQGGNSQPYFPTEADLQRFVLGESRDGGLSEQNIYVLKRPNLPDVGVVTFRINDDPADHGMESHRTLIFDARGNVLASVPYGIEIRRASTSRILTKTGNLYWDGRKWRFPKRPPDPVWD